MPCCAALPPTDAWNCRAARPTNPAGNWPL